MKQEIENRFSLLITISLFFPILLSNLATIVGQTPQKASLILIQTSVVVGLYLIDYNIFQSRKNSLSDKSLRWISLSLLIAMDIFIIPILGIALDSFNVPGWIGETAAWLSGSAVICILALPPIVELVLIFSRDKKN